ncbi:hypothetical protein H1Q59_02005 [Holosporaceae bacterium 'Namur']|nr:hypothetical protein [Holosporaceae bacterium 'Namur']
MQFTFKFIHKKEFTEENFIISYCNLEAYKAIKSFQTWPEYRMLILGPEGSGKSHLAKIFAKEAGGEFISYDDGELNLKAKAWILEDIEQFGDENQLFHKINLAKEHSISLLITAEFLPRYNLKDLQSRINATATVIIKRPDDGLLRALLMRHFSDRQLVVSSDVMEYIFTRTERSFEYIKRLVENIDKLSLEQKREITAPLVKKVLEKYMPENLADESE